MSEGAFIPKINGVNLISLSFEDSDLYFPSIAMIFMMWAFGAGLFSSGLQEQGSD